MYVRQFLHYFLIIVFFLNDGFRFWGFTETYQPPFPFTRKDDWYHGTITRAETERRLREGSSNHNEGTFFLIRRSSSKPGFYALSMLYVDRVYHFEICKRVSSFPIIKKFNCIFKIEYQNCV